MMQRMPIGNPTIIQSPSFEQISNRNFLWYVEAMLYIPPQQMPPIPVRNEHGLTHPTGFITASVTGSELIDAVLNYGVKVLRIN
jgi:hypothetical protein